MGSGSSTGKKATKAAPPPECPVFYNYSPNPQHIPASTLPTRDSRGNVRRPLGGCAARIIALRHLPVVSAEAKKEAKGFLGNVGKMRKAKEGDAAALAKIAEVEAQAKAVLQEPSLTPATSSCFLVNIAVDEQGRLAPLSTDGAAGLTDAVNALDTNVDSDNASECGSTTASSAAHPPARKGFNFEATNSSGGSAPPPSHPNARKPPQLNITPVAPDGDSNANRGMASLPSPTSGRVPPPTSSDGTVAQRLNSLEAARAGPTPPLPPTGPKTMSTVFAASDDDDDDTDSSAFMSASTRSLLIKDSRFRRSDGAETSTPGSVAAVGDPTVTRLRRQNSRIKLMQVPNRTRWFLFNDSSTHEAQVRVLFCYKEQESAGGTGEGTTTKEDCKEGGSPTRVADDYGLTPGEMKVMCVPTPLSRTAASPKEMKKQLAHSSSSSRSFVEVEPLAVAAFVAALPTPVAGPQQDSLARFEANTQSMAGMSLFVVLAPGATVFLAEGESTGYAVQTHMVPFNSSTSMAVLGRLLTPDLVRSSKEKNDALAKNCYRHKLIYLSNPVEPRRTGGPTTATNGSPVALSVAKPAPSPPTFAASPEPRSRGGSNDSAGNRGTNTTSSSLTEPGGSSQTKRAALPPIRPTTPNPTLAAADSAAPALSAGETAATAAAPEPKTQQKQHRLSCRSPTTMPGSAYAEEGKSGEAGEQNGSQPRRKRIGSMLRNPSLAAAMPMREGDEAERSFHRDLPSCNSLAISF